jgi:hypothetical protein
MIRTFILATTLLLAACAAPYSLPAEDRTAIAERIASFKQAFISNDTTQIINVIPPRMITAIAANGGVPEADLRREMAKATKRVSQQIEAISFDMTMDNATFLTTPSGRPYGLIPTRTVIKSPMGQTLQSNNNTLTIEDGGEWHLIRIDEQRQIDLLRNVYPEFEGVSFPKGTTKVVG